MSQPKRGRPPTERGAYNPHPVRQIGRVADADWQEIQQAVAASGETLTAWALDALLKKARRHNKRKAD